MSARLIRTAAYKLRLPRRYPALSLLSTSASTFWRSSVLIEPYVEAPKVFAIRFRLEQHRYFNSSPKKEEDEPRDGQQDDGSVYQHWRLQLKSIPNQITMARIASTPLLAYFICTDQHKAAFVGCLLAAFSDLLDGFLAQRYDMKTVLGTYLDPLADKIFIGAVSISLWYNGTLPTTLVSLWLAKDVALIIASYSYVATRTAKDETVMDPLTTPLKLQPTWTSKVNTALQFATLSVGIVNPLYPMPDTLMTLIFVTGGTTVLSGLSYIGYSAFEESGNDARKS